MEKLEQVALTGLSGLKVDNLKMAEISELLKEKKLVRFFSVGEDNMQVENVNNSGRKRKGDVSHEKNTKIEKGSNLINIKSNNKIVERGVSWYYYEMVDVTNFLEQYFLSGMDEIYADSEHFNCYLKEHGFECVVAVAEFTYRRGLLVEILGRHVNDPESYVDAVYPGYYHLLEVLAANGKYGVNQAELSAHYKMDSKSIFHLKKKLLANNIVTQVSPTADPPIAFKMLTKLYLSYFYRPEEHDILQTCFRVIYQRDDFEEVFGRLKSYLNHIDFGQNYVVNDFYSDMEEKCGVKDRRTVIGLLVILYDYNYVSFLDSSNECVCSLNVLVPDVKTVRVRGQLINSQVLDKEEVRKLSFRFNNKLEKNPPTTTTINTEQNTNDSQNMNEVKKIKMFYELGVCGSFDLAVRMSYDGISYAESMRFVNYDKSLAKSFFRGIDGCVKSVRYYNYDSVNINGRIYKRLSYKRSEKSSLQTTTNNTNNNNLKEVDLISVRRQIVVNYLREHEFFFFTRNQLKRPVNEYEKANKLPLTCHKPLDYLLSEMSNQQLIRRTNKTVQLYNHSVDFFLYSDKKNSLTNESKLKENLVGSCVVFILENLLKNMLSSNNLVRLETLKLYSVLSNNVELNQDLVDFLKSKISIRNQTIKIDGIEQLYEQIYDNFTFVSQVGLGLDNDSSCFPDDEEELMKNKKLSNIEISMHHLFSDKVKFVINNSVVDESLLRFFKNFNSFVVNTITAKKMINKNVLLLPGAIAFQHLHYYLMILSNNVKVTDEQILSLTKKTNTGTKKEDFVKNFSWVKMFKDFDVKNEQYLKENSKISLQTAFVNCPTYLIMLTCGVPLTDEFCRYVTNLNNKNDQDDDEQLFSFYTTRFTSLPLSFITTLKIYSYYKKFRYIIMCLHEMNLIDFYSDFLSNNNILSPSKYDLFLFVRKKNLTIKKTFYVDLINNDSSTENEIKFGCVDSFEELKRFWSMCKYYCSKCYFHKNNIEHYKGGKYTNKCKLVYSINDSVNNYLIFYCLREFFLEFPTDENLPEKAIVSKQIYDLTVEEKNLLRRCWNEFSNGQKAEAFKKSMEKKLIKYKTERPCAGGFEQFLMLFHSRYWNVYGDKNDSEQNFVNIDRFRYTKFLNDDLNISLYKIQGESVIINLLLFRIVKNNLLTSKNIEELFNNLISEDVFYFSLEKILRKCNIFNSRAIMRTVNKQKVVDRENFLAATAKFVNSRLSKSFKKYLSIKYMFLRPFYATKNFMYEKPTIICPRHISLFDLRYIFHYYKSGSAGVYFCREKSFKDNKKDFGVHCYTDDASLVDCPLSRMLLSSTENTIEENGENNTENQTNKGIEKEVFFVMQKKGVESNITEGIKQTFDHSANNFFLPFTDIFNKSFDTDVFNYFCERILYQVETIPGINKSQLIDFFSKITYPIIIKKIVTHLVNIKKMYKEKVNYTKNVFFPIKSQIHIKTTIYHTAS